MAHFDVLSEAFARHGCSTRSPGLQRREYQTIQREHDVDGDAFDTILQDVPWGVFYKVRSVVQAML
jgi:hypothetical protein